MRVAVRIAYDGTRFCGNQIQPGLRTVHGELEAALDAMGAPSTALRWAGRTDSGVSARGNVVVFETDRSPDALLSALTFRMEDVWCWAWAEVDESFEPRRARRRSYRYHLRTDLDAKAIEAALQPFRGTHDLSAFAHMLPGVEPTRTVFRVAARREGPHVVIDVEGQSFVYNQVRRMVEAAQRVASGGLPESAIHKALAAGERTDLGVAPPEPLVLMAVEYDGLDWHELPRRRLERLDLRIADVELRLATLRALGGD